LGRSIRCKGSPARPVGSELSLGVLPKSTLVTDSSRPHLGAHSCTLKYSPLLEYAGNLPEIWINIIAHADENALFNIMRVNKAWFQESVSRHWRSPPSNAFRFNLMPKKGFKGPDRVEFYASFVQHVRYTPTTDAGNQSKGYVLVKKSNAIPDLPNLRSVEFLSQSLFDRSGEQMQRIFRPSLRHVVFDDFVVEGCYGGRTRRPNGAAWFDFMTENCPSLESICLGEGLRISPEQFHHFVCRMVQLKSITLERGNEHLIIHHIGPTLKSVKIGPDWMMSQDAWNTVAQMRALEHLDIVVGDGIVTSDELLQLEGLDHLKHLHVWPANGPETTRCEMMAIGLVFFIKTLPKLRDFRLWLEFDFFRHEQAVATAYGMPGMYPKFDDKTSRDDYLEYLGKIAEVEAEEVTNLRKED
jgi:hypothetical protein